MTYSIIIDEDNLDPYALRSVFGQFLTGVTIITTIDKNGNERGFTANSFASVSLDPPLILVCIAKQAHSLKAFSESNSFGVNILAEEQEKISSLFASKQPDKFDLVAHEPKITGAPIIQDSLAWLDCTAEQNINAGDHIILIGRVKACGSRSGRPIGFWRGSYVRFGLHESADLVDPNTHKISVGCLLEHKEQILLESINPDKDLWSILHCPLRASSGGHRNQMETYLQKNSLDANLEFLYAVFDIANNDESHIIYRGHLLNFPQEHANETRFKLFPMADMPWKKIPIPEIRDLLQRYKEESAVDNYGIYIDTTQGGSVLKPLAD